MDRGSAAVAANRMREASDFRPCDLANDVMSDQMTPYV